MWDSMDAISLRTFAALLEVSSLPPVATVIATLPVVHTGVGLPLGCERPVISAVAFYADYTRCIEYDDGCRVTENELYAGRVTKMINEFEASYAGFKQVLKSPTVGRLTQHLHIFVDEEHVLRVRDTFSAVEIAVRGGMARSPSSLLFSSTHRLPR